MKDELIKLGFSQHEADIYLALLDIGQTGAGEIIKKTGLHRNIVYDTLDKLIARKLVFKVVERKVAQFKIADPERILIDQQVKLDVAKNLLPRLNQRAEVKNDIVVWDGLEGFRNFSIALIEKMRPDNDLYVLGSIGNRWYDLMGDSYKQYQRLTQKKQIRWKMVTFESVVDKDEDAMKKTGLIEVRILEEINNAPSNMLIWDDCIALQTFVEPYSVIEIKNKALADGYMNYFNVLWERGKPL